MPSPNTTVPPLRCRVYAAADFRAVLGANAGDPVGGVEAVSPGDSYRLRDDAPVHDVAICPTGAGGGARHLAEGTGIGEPGDEIRVTARLTLMAPDGQPVDLLILCHHPRTGPTATYALPLSPVTARVDYTLIRANANPGNIQLADVICASFASGTRITLPDGSQRPIERLMPGDRVLTRDHGAQRLRWNGAVTLRAIGDFAPVVIPAGTMGNQDDLVLSQNHRLFIYHRDLAPATRMPEVLIQARRLLGHEGIHLREGGFVTYHSLIFDRHEIVYAEGIPVESLLVAETTLDRLPADLSRQLRARFSGVNQPQHFGVEIDTAPPPRRARRGM